LSNIDGSGRQIKIFIHEDEETIEAGCFKGTLKEFCAKAKEEDKLRYVRIITAVVKADKEENK